MKARGFSLVEVVLSLGLLTFCVLTLLGLFMSGLNTERSSMEDQDAPSMLASLESGLESSVRNGDGTYTAGPPLAGVAWNPTATNGPITNSLGNYAYWMRIQQVGAAGDSRLINAHIEAAWPANAVRWNGDGRAGNARGQAGANVFFFLP